MIRPECIPKHIVTDQAIYTVMKLDSSCFPGKLHFLPARSLDQVVLDQHMSSKKSGDAAYSRIFDCASSHYAVTDHLSRNQFVMPAFISYIDAYRIGPVNGAVLDDPVVASVTGKSSPLRNRCSCSRMGTGNSLYFNIRKEGELRCEALLSACNLNLMV